MLLPAMRYECSAVLMPTHAGAHVTIKSVWEMPPCRAISRQRLGGITCLRSLHVCMPAAIAGPEPRFKSCRFVSGSMSKIRLVSLVEDTDWQAKILKSWKWTLPEGYGKKNNFWIFASGVGRKKKSAEINFRCEHLRLIAQKTLL